MIFLMSHHTAYPDIESKLHLLTPALLHFILQADLLTDLHLPNQKSFRETRRQQGGAPLDSDLSSVLLAETGCAFAYSENISI